MPMLAFALDGFSTAPYDALSTAVLMIEKCRPLGCHVVWLRVDLRKAFCFARIAVVRALCFMKFFQDSMLVFRKFLRDWISTLHLAVAWCLTGIA